MIASPLPSPPRKSPSPAISSARTTMPSERAIRSRPRTGTPPPGHQRQADARRARRTARPPGRRPAPARSESVPSGSRSSRTWVVDHAEQREAARHVEADEAVGRQLPAQKPTLRAPRCRVADRLALVRGRIAAARPGSRPSAAAARGRRPPGCVRRAARRCGRCRPRPSATGTPAGICTIESSESMPSRCLSGTGTPITGSGVTDASMPGRWAAPPAPAMITWSPRPAASLP